MFERIAAISGYDSCLKHMVTIERLIEENQDQTISEQTLIQIQAKYNKIRILGILKRREECLHEIQSLEKISKLLDIPSLEAAHQFAFASLHFLDESNTKSDENEEAVCKIYEPYENANIPVP